ncbi:iron-sulfur-binding ferredoxin reductase [Pseudomonas sp. dw_358]|uniref:iron-sulfur-binding ferredoxin reductase n=1 Tax=Pseudomonas sp. dw_358 TaxID=2720083 RepID=UPI001BD5C1CA|nr:iron-sulfur-binding ferredoxin reductase [Pseudomonas sp. dw_358]
MPEIRVGERHWTVAPGASLLDALNEAGVVVPYSCRAGSCHACLVHCLAGEPDDINPAALQAERRAEGWRLACQCRVVGDLEVAVFDRQRDGVPSRVVAADWLGCGVLRLRLQPSRPLRYRPGQHLVLWTDTGVARPYSLASLPGADPWLEFHIDCSQPGAFADVARHLTPGVDIRLGELSGGALHYAPDWQARPLWLLAAGTGLAPLWGVLREALEAEHQGAIRLLHLARDSDGHYLREELEALAEAWPQLQVELLTPAELPAALGALRLQSRQTMALVCGSPSSVESFSRRLFLAGLPRGQLLADVFVGRGPA